jgi:asparagine synthase (glutamine-hydrolysing)
MSGIFGIFQLNNTPVDSADLEKMAQAMRHWGPDGRGQIQAGPVGLGQLMLHNTPQAHLELLPRQTANGLLLTAEARLDNRSELCQIFAIPHPNRGQTTDSQLIELAYEKWGEDCPDHLLGDWSFAVWNPQSQRLFIARDHYGITSLYYFQDATRFLFASSREALLALGVPRRLNELYLAKVLISWPANPGDRTIDLDIYRLRPACTMTITQAETAVRQYWHLEDTPELNLPSFEDYVAGFLEIYTEAVNCRLHSSKSVGVTLSGGLDSGSVAALAARALQYQGKQLPAYTAVPLYDVKNTVGPNHFGDETEFARETANFYANIDHHLLTASQTSPIEGIRRILTLRNEPDHAGANFFWITDLLQTAKQQGIGTLLTGQGGNATISWTGAPYLTSFRQLQQKDGWKAAIKHQLPPFILRTLRLRNLKRTNWRNSAIQADFAQRANLVALQLASIGQDVTLPESIKTPRELRYAIIEPNNALPGAIWSEIGAGFGMEVRDPTLDKRILTYAISIPDHFFVGSDGQDRWLIRTAMNKLLPEKIRLATQRGRQAADIGQRLVQTRSEVEQLLDKLNQPEVKNYIDLTKLEAVWTRLQQAINQHNTRQAVSILLRGLNAGMFFLQDS